MKSLACWVCFLVGPCTWEPGQGVPGCRGGLRPSFLRSCSCLVFKRLPQEWSYLSFHLFTCTMGFAPIKWTCTALFRPRQLTDRAILANRQTQEKKGKQTKAQMQRPGHSGRKALATKKRPGGSWLPWRAAPFLLCCCSCLVLKRLPQEWFCSFVSRFHLHNGLSLQLNEGER